MESLQKVLSVDANNTRCAVSDGALVAAGRRYGRRRRSARAAGESGLTARDYRIWTTPKKMSQVPQGQFNLARQQAREAISPGAGDRRSMFNGNTPPAGLAANIT